MRILKFVAVCVFATLAAGAASPSKDGLINGDFEDMFSDGFPSGWRPSRGAVSPHGYSVERSQGPNGAAIRLRWMPTTAAPAGSFLALAQSVDATPYRGKRIRLSAKARAGETIEGEAGLILRVDRLEGRKGFFDNMSDRPIKAQEWRTYWVEGAVAEDATSIYVGLLSAGQSDVFFDDVRVEIVGAAKTSPEAATYLQHALDLLKEHHYKSAGADWAKISAAAYGRAFGAQSPRETYPAIHDAIVMLGERHTYLTPPRSLDERQALAADRQTPWVKHQTGGVGMVWLPTTGRLNDQEWYDSYSRILRDGISRGTKAAVCGWIVDLRDHTGGNSWVGLDGLLALLGDPPYGAFIQPDGQSREWLSKGEKAVMAVAGDQLTAAPSAKRQKPLAVLIGARTNSAGEMIAIAFKGRPAARLFGTPTAGQPTGNRSFLLNDGAVLAITGVRLRDRLGHVYQGPVPPEEAASDAHAAALAWLKAQGCAAAA